MLAPYLFISPALEEWETVAQSGIDVVIDLEGGLDSCIPTLTNHCLYVYFPIDDDNEKLPNMIKLRAIARLGASLIAEKIWASNYDVDTNLLDVYMSRLRSKLEVPGKVLFKTVRGVGYQFV